MKKTTILSLVLITIFVLLHKDKTFGQNIKIELGSDEVALNENFTIKITVENDRLRKYGDFPEITGFVKQGISSSSSTNIINGAISSSHSIIQNYAPTSEGTYRVPAFTMTVNDQEVSSPGKSVTVGPPQKTARSRNPFFNDPFDEFFGRPTEPEEYIDAEEDVFFALSTNKDEVYIGEGFTVTLAWYEAESNQAMIQFYDVAKQLTEILKKIKPANSWEENFNFENINERPVQINGKRYKQYKIYQATFYPLNLDPIRFPSVGLDMVKFKFSKNMSFFGRNRKEEIKTYYTKPKRVIVKELPPHPLRDAVAVGQYELKEEITSTELKTGESFSYNFRISGKGNISAVSNPVLPPTEAFEFYPPNVRQNINRGNNQVTGSKSFTYYAIPKEPGEYHFDEMFSWIYFDPVTQRYDTLQSEIIVNVSGESKKNQYISSSDMGSFYDIIEFEKNELKSRNQEQKIKIFANIIIFLMLVLTVIIIFKS